MYIPILAILYIDLQYTGVMYIPTLYIDLQYTGVMYIPMLAIDFALSSEQT